MTKCEKCGSKNLDYRSNYKWGEEWDEDNEDNIIQCDNCNNEWEEVSNELDHNNIEVSLVERIIL